VGDKGIIFGESPSVKEQTNSFSGTELVPLVLGIDSNLPYEKFSIEILPPPSWLFLTKSGSLLMNGYNS
jgi:hypothetical protein